MPLDPKQQPPYYTPGTSNQSLNKYSILNTQFTDVQTSGTTETDLYLYTLPANTLINNGDRLIINFNYILSVTGTNNIVRLYISALEYMTFATDNTQLHMRWEVNLIKISTTQLRGSITLYLGDGTYGEIHQTVSTLGTLNFTNTIPLKFTGECDSPGQLQTYSLTIDKIST